MHVEGSRMHFTEEDKVAYSLGNLDAYMELIDTGIRSICMPGIICPKDAIRWRLEWGEQSGIRHLDVVLMQSKDPRAKAIILFRSGLERDAKELKELLESKDRSAEVHGRIGQILGYSEEAIRSYLQEHPDDNERNKWYGIA